MPYWTKESAAQGNIAVKRLYEKIVASGLLDRVKKEEQEERAAAKAAAKAARTNPDAKANAPISTGSREERYGKSALEDELAILASTPESRRNIQLNESAFKLGQLIGGGVLHNANAVEAELHLVASQLGLDASEIPATLRSGMEAGKKNPRTVPPTAKQKAIAEVDAEPKESEKPRPALAPFPIDVFPTMLRKFITEGAESCRCPEDFLAAPMIVAAANMIGASRALQIKEDWHVMPGLYLAVIADPGSGKTPALSKVIGQVKRQHQLNLEAYKRERREWKAANDTTRGDAPTFRRTYTTDATAEKLASILQECPRGIVLYKDELTAWIRGMDQYKTGGKGTERQMYLSCWSNEPFSVERKSNDDGIPVTVRRPMLCVMGGIQPDMLPMLSDSMGRSDGFVDRILFCYPKWFRRPWRWSSISPEARRTWADCISKLSLLNMDHDDEGVKPMVIELDESAKTAWEQWQADHEEEQAADDFVPGLRGAWAKMDSQLARIALTLHLLWRAETVDHFGPDDVEPVDDSTIFMAAQVVAYFKSHLRRALGLLEITQEERQANALAEWLQSNGGKCTLRQIYRCKIGGVKRKSDATKLVEAAVDYDLVTAEEVKGDNGKKTTLVHLNT